MDQREKKEKIKKISILAVFTNFFLFLVKGIIGVVGGSYSVVADAFHSLSDCSTDLAILFGVKYWEAPPDKGHPYGHKRIETIITLFIGIILLIVSLGILINSIKIGFVKKLPELSGFVLIGPVLSILLKELLFHKTFKIGKETKSTSVMANAWHQRSDAISSIPPVIAIIASRINPELRFLDQIAAIIISVFILKVSVSIMKPVLLELSEKGVSEAEICQIKETILQLKEVKEVHKIRTRQIGNEIFVDLHMLVAPDMSVINAHEIANQAKDDVIRSIQRITDVVIHIEPFS